MFLVKNPSLRNYKTEINKELKGINEKKEESSNYMKLSIMFQTLLKILERRENNNE